jgi:hypothetical protein
MVPGATIEQVEAGWSYFDSLDGYVTLFRNDDREAKAALADLRSKLSMFTGQVREGVPSPYAGWLAASHRLEKALGPRVGLDGYPIR